MENKDISKDSIVRYFEHKNKNLINNYEIDYENIVRDDNLLIVEKLLDAETLTGDEFRNLVKQYTIPPVKK